MHYDWILFDADNTLLDFTAAERHSLSSAMADEGLDFQPDHHEVYHHINKACWHDFEHGRISKAQLRRERFERFFYELGVRGIDPDAFADAYLANLAHTGHLLSGALALLEALRPHYRLGLVTNGLKEVQRPRLHAAGIAGFFEVIVVSDEIGPAKPQAAFFDHAFTEMGGPERDRVLVVGDNLNADVKGGLDYGLHACWYNPEGAERYLPISPTYEIGGYGELLTLLGHG